MTTLLLLGDSLPAGFDWQRRIPGQQVINLAVPGSMTGDLLTTLPEISKRISAPDTIMVMVGTNDLLCGQPDLLDNYKRILVRLHHDYPAAEIVASSLFPLRQPPFTEQVPALNQRIEALTRQTGSCFLDIYQRLATSEAEIFQADGVHITAAAYEIWARALLEHIAFLLEDD